VSYERPVRNGFTFWELCTMITDDKVMDLRLRLRPTPSLKTAAAQSGINDTTARKYIRLGKLPSECHVAHTWRTRSDPFEGAWPAIAQQLDNDPAITPSAILASLMTQHPDRFSRAQIRTLQRRIKQWRRERSHDPDPRFNSKAASDWLLTILRGERSVESLRNELGDIPQLSCLVHFTNDSRAKDRKKALTVLAHQKGISPVFIAEFLGLTLKTVKRYTTTFKQHGVTALFARERSVIKKKDRPEYAEALFSTLHSPPSTYGINRTSWKMNDIHRVLAQQGYGMSRQNIRAILRKSGYKWLKARKVLTSKDPQYVVIHARSIT
jgi:transposase